MSVRRLITSLGLIVLTASCAETTAPGGAMDPAAPPHFIKWAAMTPARFSAEGALTQGLVPYGGGEAFVVSPPVVDAASSATGSASSLSWSHTVGTGNNRLLIVGVSIRNGNNTVTGVTYRGAALTRLGSGINSDNAVRIEMWYLPAPPSGAGTVTVTLSGGAKAVGGAMSYAGVDPAAPLRGFVTAGSSGTGTTNPAVIDSAASSELVVSAVATEGTAGATLAPTAGQSQRYKLAYGTAGGDVAGGGSSVSGAAGLSVGWTKSATAKWALAAAVIKPYVPAGLSLTSYQASFWAKRGTTRTLQINYAANGGTSPFMTLTVSDPTWAPGKGSLAVGDSVLMTATIDPNNIAVDLQPTGVLFGTPAQLQFWYGGANGDLNGDGVVDGADSTIESQMLGMWYQEGSANPWTAISATQSLGTRSFTTAIQHFSGYAVSW